jgi:hypothetical protein
MGSDFPDVHSAIRRLARGDPGSRRTGAQTLPTDTGRAGMPEALA